MITCHFTCLICGHTFSPFEVRDRDYGEMVSDWQFEKMLPALLGTHQTRSPGCTGQDLMVMVPDWAGTLVVLTLKEDNV